jgi:hypothetical protein
MHGGQEPHALAAGKRRIVLAEIKSLAGRIVEFDAEFDESPAEGLLREVKWSAQVALALGDVCTAIQDEMLSTYSGGQGHQYNDLMKAWTDERLNHAKLCKMALDAGIEKRQLDIIESQASQVVSVMLSLLTSPRLNLTSEQIIEGRVVAAQMLRSGSGPLTC